jgi:hypothetical protein
VQPPAPTQPEDDRRDFLKKAGRFAVITPPAVTFLLSTTMSSKAIAGSGGRPGWGHGDTNHGHSGPPGQSNNAAAKGKNPKGKLR